MRSLTVACMLPLAAAFQQNANFIEASADTNTMEDFDWREHEVLGSKQGDRDDKRQALTVFILPHSHDDPGWVRTADQYFDFIVGPMYTTVVAALVANEKRKFQAVEMVYFKQWYETVATPTMRAQAHGLVASDQLSFAVGGWVMPDEATTDLADLVETMSLGQRWIYETFNKTRVKHGFQVDPFGASSSFAALSAKLGFQTHLVARLNYFDKGWMQDNKQLEFMWRPSPSLYAAPEKLQVFTHIMDQFQYAQRESSPQSPGPAQPAPETDSSRLAAGTRLPASRCSSSWTTCAARRTTRATAREAASTGTATTRSPRGTGRSSARSRATRCTLASTPRTSSSTPTS